MVRLKVSSARLSSSCNSLYSPSRKKLTTVIYVTACVAAPAASCGSGCLGCPSSADVVVVTADAHAVVFAAHDVFAVCCCCCYWLMLQLLVVVALVAAVVVIIVVIIVVLIIIIVAVVFVVAAASDAASASAPVAPPAPVAIAAAAVT